MLMLVKKSNMLLSFALLSSCVIDSAGGDGLESSRQDVERLVASGFVECPRGLRSENRCQVISARRVGTLTVLDLEVSDVLGGSEVVFVNLERLGDVYETSGYIKHDPSVGSRLSYTLKSSEELQEGDVIHTRCSFSYLDSSVKIYQREVSTSQYVRLASGEVRFVFCS